MLAWFGDIKELTEKKGEARNEFVRRSHARSLSGNSLKAASINSSEGDMAEDEADKAPFSGEQSVRGQSVSDGAPIIGGVGGAAAARELEDNRSEAGWRPNRPQPGGRFPSDVNVARGLQAPVSPSSGGGDSDREAIAAAGALPGSGVPFENTPHQHTDLQNSVQPPGNEMVGAAPSAAAPTTQVHGLHPNVVPNAGGVAAPADGASSYGEWMAPIAAGTGVGGAVVGAGIMHHHQTHQQSEGQPIETVDNSNHQMDVASAVPAYGTSSAPIPVAAAAEDHERSLSRPRGLTESTQATGTASHFAPSTVGAATINSTTTAPTEYSVDRPPLDKVKTSKSVTTISDLAVPGQYPITPGTSELPTPQNGPVY